MNLRHTAAATLFALHLLTPGAHAAAAPLDAAGRGEIVTALARQLDDFYVYPDVAAAMGQSLRAKQQAGGYDSIDDPRAFADALTADLRAVSHDKHLRVVSGDNPRPMAPPSATPTAEQEAAMLKHFTATTEIYTLSLHDALPIWRRRRVGAGCQQVQCKKGRL